MKARSASLGENRTDTLDANLLLRVLTDFRSGDFTSRLPADQNGLAGRIYDTLNEIIELNDALAKELLRLRAAVGQEGKFQERASVPDASGDWTIGIDSVNGLVQDLFESAELANRAKDEFLATLSHEIRTPLNAILGWIQVLRSKKVDEATFDRAMETIYRNARSQAELIDGMLDVSSVITGRICMEISVTGFESAVQAALDAVRPAAEAKGLQMECSIDAAQVLILGDSRRLQQIAWNLLSNAVKFTPAGGVVRVQLTADALHARLTVSDTGRGIDPEFLPFVFDRFRQAEGAMSRKYGGLGLGLSITRHLVELHGGTIEVCSEGAEKGATFTVCLPIREAVPAPVRSEPTP